MDSANDPCTLIQALGGTITDRIPIEEGVPPNIYDEEVMEHIDKGVEVPGKMHQ